MAHTASAGVYIFQDPHSGVWQVGSSAAKQAFSQRFWLATLPLRSSKLVIGGIAVTVGVSFSLLSSYYLLNGDASINPTLALQPPAPLTQSVGLSAAPYMIPSLATAESLPLSTFPGSIELPPPLAVGQVSPLATRNNIAPFVVANARSQVPVKDQPKDESPLVIFNQPLPPKPAESPSAKQASGPLPKQTHLDPVVPVVQTSPVRNDPSASPGPQKPVQLVAAANTADPAALPVRPSTSQSVNILAVPTSESIVVTNPTTRLPMVVKVGDRLPDGSTLKTVDKSTSSATNSRGETLSLR
jgi:hypothetical protein